ncbi:hypothetical protein HPB51_024475 [Rhipicephalus microplus]|uniref:Uncharacterized protein n=1 Tax=Rhipicephalus microplus TaxID=6941 RepID=A0A9J6FAC2_RHIMP|nr:hypothetical protein HPB51_024475 [Rhipicephalus microplus]
MLQANLAKVTGPPAKADPGLVATHQDPESICNAGPAAGHLDGPQRAKPMLLIRYSRWLSRGIVQERSSRSRSVYPEEGVGHNEAWNEVGGARRVVEISAGRKSDAWTRRQDGKSTPDASPSSSSAELTPVHVRSSHRLQGLKQQHGLLRERQKAMKETPLNVTAPAPAHLVVN